MLISEFHKVIDRRVVDIAGLKAAALYSYIFAAINSHQGNEEKISTVDNRIYCRISQAEMCEDTGMSRDEVMTALKRLKEANLIEARKLRLTNYDNSYFYRIVEKDGSIKRDY